MTQGYTTTELVIGAITAEHYRKYENVLSPTGFPIGISLTPFYSGNRTLHNDCDREIRVVSHNLPVERRSCVIKLSDGCLLVRLVSSL